MSPLVNYLLPVAICLLGLFLLKRELDEAAADTESAQPVPATAPALSAEPEVPMAVIAAAVAAVVEEPHHVVEVRPVREVSWSLEGRRQLLLSHQLRK